MPIVSPPQSTMLLHTSTGATETMLCHHAYNHHQQQQKQEQEVLNKIRRLYSTLHADQTVPDTVSRYHTHTITQDQCSSVIIQHICAPISTVWSLLRRFDNPQAYKHFLKSCQLIAGDGRAVGTLREVQVISGLPAARSTERLDILDEDRHVIGFSIVGGDHRLSNYRSVTTLHSSGAGDQTVVVESYEVDVPAGNTKDDTCVFVDTIIRCNLQSLARIAQGKSKAVASATK